MDHPNILKLHDIYEDSKRYYIVTEYFTLHSMLCRLLLGGELLDRISIEKKFTEYDAAKIMKQILEALTYCHSKYIVHRDIKPQNILFETKEKNSRIKILDFATSQNFDPNKKMLMRVGSPYYIAPEVLRRSYNEKCDVWSCGVILYILLSGYSPFNGKSVQDLLQAIGRGEYSMKGN